MLQAFSEREEEAAVKTEGRKAKMLVAVGVHVAYWLDISSGVLSGQPNIGALGLVRFHSVWRLLGLSCTVLQVGPDPRA